ncbi:MAG: hypothetical protein H6995_11645 [Pseudomonadales bacterium]|nr:hypothetical protein [Pseudomonadales bacterium]MCP5215649.1 hypothetical protein [Pseudomonadales bacterium]
MIFTSHFPTITLSLRAIVLGTLFLLLPQLSLAGISLTPSFVSVKMDSGKRRVSGKFEIANTGDTEERYRVKANHFVFHEDGSFSVMKPDANSLASWIKFNPKEFALAPNSKRTVRYTIIPRVKAENGHYWGVMELESLVPVAHTQKLDETNLTINFAQSILVPMYAAVGELSYKGEIENVKLEKGDVDGQQLLKIVIANLSNGALFLSGKYKLTSKSGETVHEDKLSGGVILPEMKREYLTKLSPEIEPGQYAMHIEYFAPDLKEKLTKELTFNR